jgi:hypothetical protein
MRLGRANWRIREMRTDERISTQTVHGVQELIGHDFLKIKCLEASGGQIGRQRACVFHG